MKKFISILLVLVLSLGVFAACGEKETPVETPAEVNDQEEAPAEAPTEAPEEVTEETSAEVPAVEGKVGLSISTLNNPYFVTLKDSVQAKADELGIELVVLDASDDPAKQVSDIEDLISQGVVAIIVNPVDSDTVAAPLEEAKTAGIKVVAVDRGVNGVEIDAQIASDNYAGGVLAGEYMIELVGEGAQVAMLEGIPGASSTAERGGGFEEAVNGKLEIVSSQTANYNRAEGLTVTENVLQGNPDIKGIFAQNDEMALGALEAVKSAGLDIVVIGFDATDDALTAIEAGEISATVAQQPDLMGEVAVETVANLIAGNPVESEIPVEVALVK